jgi:hypothetical protein
MKQKGTLALVVAFLALSPLLGFAQASEKPLTDREAAKLIADWPGVYSWFADRGRKMQAAGDGAIPSALLTDKEFAAYIGKRGWAAGRFWYATGTAFSLLGVVNAERKSPEIAKQFDDAIAEIQASGLPASEKAANVKSLGEAKAAALSLPAGKDIDQGELGVVRAHFDEFMKMAEGLRDE